MASVTIKAVYSTGAVYTTWVTAAEHSQDEAESVQSPLHRRTLLTAVDLGSYGQTVQEAGKVTEEITGKERATENKDECLHQEAALTCSGVAGLNLAGSKGLISMSPHLPIL